MAAAAPLRLSHDHWDRRAAALTGPAAGRSARYINVSHLIETYGHLAVFLLVGAESLGIQLPGETALILAGTYAGHTHRLSPWLIFLVATAAAIIGYWIGEKRATGWPGGTAQGQAGRAQAQDRPLPVRPLRDRVVFFGRFVSVLRTYAAFLAGVNRMRWRRFLPVEPQTGPRLPTRPPSATAAVAAAW